MPRPITRRQLEVLQAIAAHQEETSLSPTLEELGNTLGGINRVTVYGHVQSLLQKGLLENLEPGASRGLDLTEQGRAVLTPVASKEQQPSPEGKILHFPIRSGIPLLGKIAAGSPIEAIEQEEWVAVEDLLPNQSDLYMLEVQGDSMIEDHIQSGDLVLVRRDVQPTPGQIVVAILENEEATLKRFFPEPDGKIRLQPANSKMEPIYTTQLEIRGVVVSVIRQY
ncbi:MAG TPA: transcriptional repressor LexA [Planctomycetota bacterium]|jgi:repressor LexA|nr:transcriptional repressor LexA [Planctomycetota bacterium]HJM38583.1 transcriptional repressor LexA [Planctomycetota bacterium]|tara:strand:- start:598 stop:1269 length:672 start_codon:yes stop_codon:yes gene_type:complete